jgi:hypothetical protein
MGIARLKIYEKRTTGLKRIASDYTAKEEKPYHSMSGMFPCRLGLLFWDAVGLLRLPFAPPFFFDLFLFFFLLYAFPTVVVLLFGSKTLTICEGISKIEDSTSLSDDAKLSWEV